MTNPFQIGQVVEGSSFIGRKEKIKKFRSAVKSKKTRIARSVVGITRIGKTSFVNQVISNLPDYIIPISINLKEEESYFSFWQTICRKIYKALQEKNYENEFYEEEIQKIVEVEKIPDWGIFKECIKTIFEEISDSVYKILVVIDEFDDARDKFKTIENFGTNTNHFELLRTLLSGAKYKCFSSIIISRCQLHTIEGTTFEHSTFHGVLNPEYFKGLDDLDMEEYWAIFNKKKVLITNDQKKQIQYYTGDSPYLLSIMGHEILETARIKEKIDIEQIFIERCKLIQDYYRDCIKHLRKDNDLKRVIPFVLGPKIGVEESDKIELIENLGYLHEDKDNESFYVISKYFNSFMVSNYIEEVGNIWPELISTEKQIKKIIRKEQKNLKKNFGFSDSDILELQKKILLTSGDKEKDICRYESFIKENKKYHKKSDFFDVMSFGSCIKIVNKAWDQIFMNYFSKTSYIDWKMKFEKCVRARNPIAHGHEEYLSDTEINEVNIYCKQIKEEVDKNNGIEVTIKQDNLAICSGEYDKYIGQFCLFICQNYNAKENLIGSIELSGKKVKASISKDQIKDEDKDELLKHKIEVQIEKIELTPPNNELICRVRFIRRILTL